ncbi:hypothetical protein HAX54_045670 [Datura stramonium]|uniref:AMP-dependent synthetase/ligase domain-containing protein n=1 Tax=Datura stramonium TaxID=4076 RepID=A0ABS8RPK3_DATST|nr:hypothetical protein [Datura stramonium]
MAGAVLCTLNIRHDSNMLSVLLRHSEAKRVIFVDQHLLQVAQGAIDILANEKLIPPLLVLISESHISSPTVLSRPKGVVYNHRGAYLNTIATFMLHEMSSWPVYLWTVPTFHCNGWCLTWGLAALGGTSICLRQDNLPHYMAPRAEFEFTPFSVRGLVICPKLVRILKLTLAIYGGFNAVSANYFPLTPISFLDRAAKLSADVATLAPNVPAVQELHFAVPMAGAVLCTLNTRHDSAMVSVLLRHSEAKIIFVDQQFFEVAQAALDLLADAKTKPLLILIPDPENLPPPVVAPNVVHHRLYHFQDGGVRLSVSHIYGLTGIGPCTSCLHGQGIDIKRSDTMEKVRTIATPLMATLIKDRMKDIIISGENICSVWWKEFCGHPAVLEAAVVARPDDHWGQTPCAFREVEGGI